MSDSLFGVTVMPEYLQSEGVEQVLDRLQQAGAGAVATSPYVMAPADEATGAREPPIDAGAGSVRLLDRPLWGRRELWVRTAPSYAPDQRLYHGLRYQPAAADELTQREGPVIRRLIDSAHARGMRVYFQVMAAIPPGYRVQFGGPAEEDQPRLPDGRIPTRRVDNNGSLASDAIREYQRALIHDLLGQYGDIDAIRFDWPEYPPYLLDSIFLDFGEHARTAAERLGFDFERMRHDAAELYDWLHGSLQNVHLDAAAGPDGGRYALACWLADRPGLIEWLRFKAALSVELLAGFRLAMNEAGGRHVKLAPSAFPPPWNLLSGMEYRGVGRVAEEISVKLYGMHWAMMLHFYGRQLLAANPQAAEAKLVRALVALFDIADDEGNPRLSDYRYPEPDQPHPIGEHAQLGKIAQAQARAGKCPIHVLAHSYGPVEDFCRRIAIARAAAPHGIWINRYGYLSDEKLAALAKCDLFRPA